MILILQILEDTSPFPIATHGQSSWEWIKTLIGTHTTLSPIFPRTVLNCAHLHTAFQLYQFSIVSREDIKRKHLMRSIYANILMYTSVIICVHIICIWNIHIDIHVYIYTYIFFIYVFGINSCRSHPHPPASSSSTNRTFRMLRWRTFAVLVAPHHLRCHGQMRNIHMQMAPKINWIAWRRSFWEQQRLQAEREVSWKPFWKKRW